MTALSIRAGVRDVSCVYATPRSANHTWSTTSSLQEAQLCLRSPVGLSLILCSPPSELVSAFSNPQACACVLQPARLCLRSPASRHVPVCALQPSGLLSVSALSKQNACACILQPARLSLYLRSPARPCLRSLASRRVAALSSQQACCCALQSAGLSAQLQSAAWAWQPPWAWV